MCRVQKEGRAKTGNGDEVLSTNLGTIWKLLRPPWCPHPHASLIEEVTERVRMSGEFEFSAQIDPTSSGVIGGGTSKLDKLVKKIEPSSCLDLACGGGEHYSDGQSCVRIQSFQWEGLATWFGDITEKEKSEVQIMAE